MSTPKTKTTATTNATKVNKSFTDIEKMVNDLTVGTKISVAKYTDGKNGYIGLKFGRTNQFSLFGLTTDNENKKKWCFGCTDTVFDFLKTAFDNTESVELIKNGNSGDKSRPNKIELNDFALVSNLFETVVKQFA